MNNNSHSYKEDKRNDNIIIYINGHYFKRSQAKISVFDSGFLLGDGVWESMRYHNGHLCFLEHHLNRLYCGSKSIDIEIDLNKNKLTSIIKECLKKNSMFTDVHIRIIISRGLKKTPYQHPSANTGGISLVIIPEFKIPNEKVNINGISLMTANTIRSTDNIQDPKINSLSKFNCISACIESYKSGYDEALMLDINDNVSTCNSTNFFIVKNNKVITSTGKYCLNGITRENIIDLCKSNDIPVFEKNFQINTVYDADEAFITGTFAGVIPVRSLDDKNIGNGKRGTMTKKLSILYKKRIEKLYPDNGA